MGDVMVIVIAAVVLGVLNYILYTKYQEDLQRIVRYVDGRMDEYNKTCNREMEPEKKKKIVILTTMEKEKKEPRAEITTNMKKTARKKPGPKSHKKTETLQQ